MKRHFLFFLFIANLIIAMAQSPLTIHHGDTWRNYGMTYTSDLQLKIVDSIVFDWPSIIGHVIINEKTDSNALYECLYTKSILIGDSISYNPNIKVCSISVMPQKGHFTVLIDSSFFKLTSDPNNTFDSMYKASRLIQKDSTLQLETIFMYYQLAESLAKAHYYKQSKVFERLDNFYVYFPFLVNNNLTTEFPACRVLGKTLLLYFD